MLQIGKDEIVGHVYLQLLCKHFHSSYAHTVELLEHSDKAGALNRHHAMLIQTMSVLTAMRSRLPESFWDRGTCLRVDSLPFQLLLNLLLVATERPLPAQRSATSEKAFEPLRIGHIELISYRTTLLLCARQR